MNDEKTIYDSDNTVYDDERTQYLNRDDEATLYDDSYEKTEATSKTTIDSVHSKQQKKQHGCMWKRVAAGAGTGIVLGAATTVLTSGAAPASQVTNEDNGHPDWTDGNISVATKVTDDMTFSEAFETARTETGSGGVFEWHGYIYSTYTEDEWNSMTAEQRTEYGSHLKWSGDTSDVAVAGSNTQDELEVVAVDDSNMENSDEVPVIDSEPEVEVLGANTGTIEDAGIGGDDVVIVDVDGPDMTESYEPYDLGAEIDYIADNGMDDYVNDAYMQEYEG